MTKVCCIPNKSDTKLDNTMKKKVHNIKYVVIYLIWENKDILKENYKTPRGQVKEDTNKWCYLPGRNNAGEMNCYKDIQVGRYI